MMSDTDKKQRTRSSNTNKYCYNYSLDVVTDGSEATEPTVFLSVTRQLAESATATAAAIDDDDDYEANSQTTPTLARYAIVGLSEMTGRLVADQKFSWATTRAVFLYNNHHVPMQQNSQKAVSGSGGGGLWGLPGILFALKQAGAAELTVVAGTEDDASSTEAMVKSLSLWANNPHIRIAAVPSSESSNANAKDDDESASTAVAISWWKMYEDEFIMVHASCPSGRPENLIYLFTCRKHKAITNYTIAVLPGSASRQTFLDIWEVPRNRVVLDIDTGNGSSLNESEKNLSLQALFVIDVDSQDPQQAKFFANAGATFPGIPVFACKPNAREEGVLLWARNLAESWNKALPSNIIYHNSPSSQHRSTTTATRDDDDGETSNILYLPSCSSVRCTLPPRLVDRKVAISKRIKRVVASPEDVKAVESFFQSRDANTDATPTLTLPWIDELQDDNEINIEDDNEIDIDDDGGGSESEAVPIPASQLDGNEIDIGGSDDETTTPSPKISTRSDSPHLLVLGTGCAAPSPHRGSSGYGLLFPQQINRPSSHEKSSPHEALLLTAIIECGEGISSMLLRHLPSVVTTSEMNDLDSFRLHLCHVQFIWISHAHFDHYGGLPSIVSTIHECRRELNRTGLGTRDNKRPRVETSEPRPLLIIAPRVVLRYLDVALLCNRGAKRGSPLVRLFHGFTHEEHASWWAALASIQLLRLRREEVVNTSSILLNQNRGVTPSNLISDSFAYRPFAFWNNVRVEHSCFCAFGFVMGIHIPSQHYRGDHCGAVFHHPTTNQGNQMELPLVTFAYSGDTRPCWRLVQQCRLDCGAFSQGRLDFLLHEASFDDDEQAMSVDKKHSSLSEALKVGSDANAAHVILTHFSQRYTSYPPMKLPAAADVDGVGQGRATVFGLDGMLIPLK